MENFEGDNEPTVLILGELMPIPIFNGERKLRYYYMFRCWTRWPHFRSSTAEPWRSNLDHRPQSSSRRQLA